MNELWKAHFPSTPEECKGWRPVVRDVSLGGKVLAVMTTRIEGAWCAYIGSVGLQDLATDVDAVLRLGSKLDERIALAIFPEMAGVPYAW